MKKYIHYTRTHYDIIAKDVQFFDLFIKADFPVVLYHLYFLLYLFNKKHVNV